MENLIMWLVVIILLCVLIGLQLQKNKKNVPGNEVGDTQEATNKLTEQTENEQKNSGLTPEEEAAVFMALHLFVTESLHDEESNIITLERIQRRYSPWNSKIYNMNNFQ